jgi:D-3-phosphoglycerate dehydrogenase
MGELAQLGLPIHANPKGRELNEEELSNFLVESAAKVAIVGREIVSGNVLDQAKNLQFIAKYGVGLDNLDPLDLSRRGIELGWTGGVNRRAVAELVLGFATCHLRNIFVSVDRLRQGSWIKDGGRDLSAQTIGIIGYGCVGSEVAKIMGFLGCKIVYTDVLDRSLEAQAVAAQALPLEQLLRVADVVTLHVPLTAETKGMIGARELGQMKPSALLINTSRGAVVDFAAASRAVMEGKMGGFAADVFPEEPMDLTPWNHPHLYFTPHIGGNSLEAVLAMGRSAIGHVQEFLARSGDRTRR